MKHLILENNLLVETVAQTRAHEASRDKYYGFVNGKVQGNDKGFLILTDYYDGVYDIVAIDGMTHHNGWMFLKELKISNIDAAIKAVLNENNSFQVVAFDNKREFLNWLAE